MQQQPSLDDPRYPIGPFQPSSGDPAGQREHWIARIAATPGTLRGQVMGLDEHQLDTPYRDGGWTVRQLVHHVPDSHLNAYVRFKLALTEDTPTIRPYDEAAWAELPDTRATPIATSLALLESVHERWVHLLRAITPGQWDRRLVHPERGELTLDYLLALYAWHGDHHVAHVRRLRERMGW